MLQDSPQYVELFQGLGLKQYFRTYIEPMIPFYAARKELNAFYEKKYPTLARTADQIAARDALRYFQTHFAEQSIAFQEKWASSIVHTHKAPFTWEQSLK